MLQSVPMGNGKKRYVCPQCGRGDRLSVFRLPPGRTGGKHHSRTVAICSTCDKNVRQWIVATAVSKRAPEKLKRVKLGAGK